jgi:hypothetical protein
MVAFLAGRPLRQCSQRRDGKALAELGIASPYLPSSISGLKPTRIGGLPGRTLTGREPDRQRPERGRGHDHALRRTAMGTLGGRAIR